MTDTEFRHLKVLAQTDVAGFVAARRELIERMISGTDPERQAKLWQLQDEIELMRATTPNADQVTHRLAQMISERLDALDLAFSRLPTAAEPIGETVNTAHGAKHQM